MLTHRSRITRSSGLRDTAAILERSVNSAARPWRSFAKTSAPSALKKIFSAWSEVTKQRNEALIYILLTTNVVSFGFLSGIDRDMKHSSDFLTQNSRAGLKSGTASRSWLWLLVGIVIFAAASGRAETNIIRRQILLPDGHPAVGAKIHGMVLSRDEQRREIRMVADAVGKFTADFALQGYDEGCLTIDATNCALFVLRLYGKSWMHPTNQVENLFPTVQLKPAYPVAGRVVDEKNRAVMGARMATMFTSA